MKSGFRPIACFAECLVLAGGVSSKPVRFLLFEQSADAGGVGHGKRIAVSQAGVYVHLAASHLLGSYTGRLVFIQAEDTLLILLELWCVCPGHIVASWKP